MEARSGAIICSGLRSVIIGARRLAEDRSLGQHRFERLLELAGAADQVAIRTEQGAGSGEQAAGSRQRVGLPPAARPQAYARTVTRASPAAVTWLADESQRFYAELSSPQ
jgi:hypothetical protein